MHQLKFKLGLSKLNLKLRLILLCFLVASCAAVSLLRIFGHANPLPVLPIASTFLGASCAAVSLLGLPSVANLLPIVPSLPLPTPTPLLQSSVIKAVVVPFDSDLRAIAITRGGSKLYAADGLNNTVSVIDVSKNEVIATLNVGTNPSNIAITPDSSKVYVANSGTDSAPGNTVSVIDVRNDAVIGEPIEVGLGPSGIAITPDSSKVYVANSSGDTVSVIDVQNDRVIGNPVVVGLGPSGMAITPKDCAFSKVYVANFLDNTVSVIDVQNDKAIDDPIPVGFGPSGITITPDCSKVYVANSNSDTVSVIDTSTNEVMTVPVGSNPVVVILAPDGSKVYVANSGTNTVSLIDGERSVTDPTNAVIDTVAVGPNPIGIAITGDSSKLYVANSGTDSTPSNTVSVIELKTNDDGETSFNLVNTIQVATTAKASPVAITMKPDSSRVYVANVDSVSVIDVSNDKVIKTINATSEE